MKETKQRTVRTVNLPEALKAYGDCRCGEHAYTIRHERSQWGRGRPNVTSVGCAACGARFFNLSI